MVTGYDHGYDWKTVMSRGMSLAVSELPRAKGDSMKVMEMVAFLSAACFAAGAAVADDQRGTGPNSSASAGATTEGSAGAGATTEKNRTAGGVSEDLLKEFRGLDSDKDGFLSRSELSSKRELAEAFDKADKDGDGKLDPAEYRVLQAEVNIKG
jgi:hypothetical protein